MLRGSPAAQSQERRPVQWRGAAELVAFARGTNRDDAESIEGGVGAVVVALDVQHIERCVAHRAAPIAANCSCNIDAEGD